MWANSSFCVKIAEKNIEVCRWKGGQLCSLLCQFRGTENRFIHKPKEPGGLVSYGAANATDTCQPIDAGYAQLLRMLIKEEFF